MILFDPEPAIAPGLIVQFPLGNPASSTLPVATSHVGCVTELTKGAEGVTGCGLIITFADAIDVHPTAFVTVKLCVPATRLVTVLLVPVPAIVPGFIVQFPEGKPFNTTLPVATAQVGCVITPTVGAEGVAGCALITTFAEGNDVHPCVTVKLYVPAVKPDMVLLRPGPAIAPGLIVQFPDGKPFNMTLPVATEQVGCVIALTIGVEGVAVIIATLADGNEVQPTEFVTVKPYVPGAMPDIVILELVPETAPGLIIQLPEGKPLNTTLPVETAQVG